MAIGKITIAVVLTAAMTLCHTAASSQRVLSNHEMDSITALLPNMPDNKEKLDNLYDLSRNHIVMDSIIKYSLSAYYLAKRLKLPTYVASTCLVIGWYYNTNGKYALAPKYFKEAGEIYDELHKPINKAMTISNCGDSYIGLGKFEQGVNCKLEALKLFEAQSDLANTALIYRTIGQSCTQFQQYKPALEYLDKALSNDLKVANARGTGRDYYYIGLTLQLSSTNNELAKEYLLQGLRIQEDIHDHVFVAKTCGLLSLLYTDIYINTNIWEYADSSYYYYKKGYQIIEQTGYKGDNDIYHIASAEHTMMSGNYIKAMQMLLEKIEKPSQPLATLNLLNQALQLCFKYNQNYKGLFELSQRLERDRKKIYISEFELDFSRYNKRKELAEQLHDMILTAERRTKDFESVNGQLNYARLVLIYILTCAAAIIALFSYQIIKNRQYNAILQQQTDELQATNEELNALLAESQLQSELITEQTIEMKRQRNKLASINLRIVINLDIASRFQTSLMPTQETIQRIFKKIFVLWRPLEEVSGDFYWVTEAYGYKFLAVADCTGHGIPGASLSMLGISFLNSIVARIDLRNINAAEVLTKLRYRITESLTRGSVNNEDIHDGMDIAVCIFDTKNSKISYAGAYRPLWIVNNGQLTEYKPDKIPIAVDKDRNSDFTNNEITLQQGDRVYIFSDGITDQFGERENGKLSKFKPKRLRELLCNIYNLAPERQMREIESAIDQWRGDSEQTDDITVIGVMEA